jgi:2'-5' RNA ligase
MPPRESTWVRAFVGIDLTPDVRRRLVSARESLKDTGAHVAWVAEPNLHVSLAFLGDISLETVRGVGDLLDGVARETARFVLEIGGMGWFGAVDSPRVVWAGVGAGADAAKVLRARIAAGLPALGVAVEEREFRPHVTVGRVKSSRGRAELCAAVSQFRSGVFGSAAVDRMVLFRSILRPHGPEYSVLHVAEFGRVLRSGIA